MTVISNPRLVFKALNSCMRSAECFVDVPEEAMRSVRCTQIFSAIHGFMGPLRLITYWRTTTNRNVVVLTWKTFHVSKEFISSISWCFKVVFEAGYIKAKHIAWTEVYSKIYAPFQVLSLASCVIKTKNLCTTLLQTTDNKKLPTLRYKSIVSLFHAGSKSLSLSAYIIQAMCPQAKLLISLNLVAISAIKIAILFLGSSVYAKYQSSES